MNRELEFRVYDYDAKKMRYLKNEHDFICFNSDGGAYYHNMQTGLGEWFSDLMQYTGLKDKNGVKIFEGDIVKYTDEVPYTVMFDPTGYWCLDGNGIRNSEMLIQDDDTNNYIEVIGNIYEDNKGSESND